MNTHFDPFVIPFSVGVLILFGIIVYRYIRWFFLLPLSDRLNFAKYLFTWRSLKALKEVVEESILHKSIWKVNPLLGYMHTSFALGWLLLIIVGKLETSAYLKDLFNPPYLHVFFRFFYPEESFRFHRGFNYVFLMDLLLLFVLSGLALALFKRLRSKILGMRKTTRHTLGDRIAMTTLWVIFPARLLAESITCGLKQTEPLPTALGNFMTHGIGQRFAEWFGPEVLAYAELPAWWLYSFALGIFFVAMPFSRYMHIFTEVPYIFLRNFKIRSRNEPSSYDHFQLQSCSRCGICIDPCQMQSVLGVDDIQSVYFLRDRRYGFLRRETADNCLVCGRCEAKCPVGLELNQLRINSRASFREPTSGERYEYIRGKDGSTGEGTTGYFAGCMTLLQPKVLDAMARIFEASGDEVWWADKNGGVCCGRPLKLSGDVEGSRRLIECNREAFRARGLRTLVTSCPICLKVFTEDYDLKSMGIEVLHHSQYILRQMQNGVLRIDRTDESITYHDPCELGRGLGIYEVPRMVLKKTGTLLEPKRKKKNALCCGGSLGSATLTSSEENRIATDALRGYVETGAETLVTACPQCKSAFRRNTSLPVMDLAEVVARRLSC